MTQKTDFNFAMVSIKNHNILRSYSLMGKQPETLK